MGNKTARGMNAQNESVDIYLFSVPPGFHMNINPNYFNDRLVLA